MASIKQEVFEVRYVRSSEERCSILKACHVDITSRHMGVKRTSHRVLERFFWKGVTKDIEIMVSVKKYLSFLITCICLLHRSLPVTSVKGIARNCPFQHQNCFQFQSIHPGITWALILLALFHLRPPREIATFLPLCDYFTKWVEAVALPTKEASGIASSLFKVYM